MSPYIVRIKTMSENGDNKWYVIHDGNNLILHNATLSLDLCDIGSMSFDISLKNENYNEVRYEYKQIVEVVVAKTEFVYWRGVIKQIHQQENKIKRVSCVGAGAFLRDMTITLQASGYKWTGSDNTNLNALRNVISNYNESQIYEERKISFGNVMDYTASMYPNLDFGSPGFVEFDKVVNRLLEYYIKEYESGYVYNVSGNRNELNIVSTRKVVFNSVPIPNGLGNITINQDDVYNPQFKHNADIFSGVMGIFKTKDSSDKTVYRTLREKGLSPVVYSDDLVGEFGRIYKSVDLTGDNDESTWNMIWNNAKATAESYMNTYEESLTNALKCFSAKVRDRYVNQDYSDTCVYIKPGTLCDIALSHYGYDEKNVPIKSVKINLDDPYFPDVQFGYYVDERITQR